MAFWGMPATSPRSSAPDCTRRSICSAYLGNRSFSASTMEFAKVRPASLALLRLRVIPATLRHSELGCPSRESRSNARYLRSCRHSLSAWGSWGPVTPLFRGCDTGSAQRSPCCQACRPSLLLGLDSNGRRAGQFDLMVIPHSGAGDGVDEAFPVMDRVGAVRCHADHVGAAALARIYAVRVHLSNGATPITCAGIAAALDDLLWITQARCAGKRETD